MPNLFSNLLKTLSSIENVKIFPILTRDFWHIANNISNNFTSSFFPPLLQPEGSIAVSSFSKTEIFAQTIATSSTLDDTGYIHLTPLPSDYFIHKIKILHYNVFHALANLDSRKTYGPDGIQSVVLKNCASELAHWSNSFVCVFLLLPILHARILLTFNLSLKCVIAPILQTTAIELWCLAFLKPLSLSLTRR